MSGRSRNTFAWALKDNLVGQAGSPKPAMPSGNNFGNMPGIRLGLWYSGTADDDLWRIRSGEPEDEGTRFFNADAINAWPVNFAPSGSETPIFSNNTIGVVEL